MYYDPEKNDHGLARGPFKSCVVPRPIGWISTVSATGIHNLAPYSQFQNLGFDPAYVMISANQGERGKRKDTVVNIEETGEFVYNMATYDLREAVNHSAAEVSPDVGPRIRRHAKEDARRVGARGLEGCAGGKCIGAASEWRPHNRFPDAGQSSN